MGLSWHVARSSLAHHDAAAHRGARLAPPVNTSTSLLSTIPLFHCCCSRLPRRLCTAMTNMLPPPAGPLARYALPLSTSPLHPLLAWQLLSATASTPVLSQPSLHPCRPQKLPGCRLSPPAWRGRVCHQLVPSSLLNLHVSLPLLFPPYPNIRCLPLHNCPCFCRPTLHTHAHVSHRKGMAFNQHTDGAALPAPTLPCVVHAPAWQAADKRLHCRPCMQSHTTPPCSCFIDKS